MIIFFLFYLHELLLKDILNNKIRNVVKEVY